MLLYRHMHLYINIHIRLSSNDIGLNVGGKLNVPPT